MMSLNSRKRDCGHMGMPAGYASSTVISLWNAGARACSQSRFPGSSASYKPDIRHLLMLHKMCLMFLQSDFVWFFCVYLNSIWVGKPVARNKMALFSSLNGDELFGFFFSTVENCGSFVWKTLKAICFLSCFSNARVSCVEVKCKTYATWSKFFLTFFC